MQQDSSLRNLIIAMVAIAGVMLIWQLFIWGPESKARQAELDARQAERIAAEGGEGIDLARDPMDPEALDATVEAEAVAESQAAARVPFDGPAMDGTIYLRGARVDNLKLKDYYNTLEDKETQNPDGEVTIFQPQETGNGYYASVGWREPDAARATITPDTVWTQTGGDTLTPTNPIELTFEGGGLKVVRTVSIDDHYMFTFNDTVTNTSGGEMSVQPYGVLRQFGMPEDLANFYILHEGLVAATGNELKTIKYKKLEKGEELNKSSSNGGWIGLTSKYWLGAIIPEQDQPFDVSYRTLNVAGGQELRARMDGAIYALGAGETTTYETRVFGGAKVAKTLEAYEKDLGIPRFQDAIDWGSMFFWLTKPFFFILSWINGYVGNFGVSILILTVLVKALFFPIQNKAYQSMAKMRELAEPMKKIREEIEDKQEQQRKLAELYREKKVNPVGGCLPILIQIPVFYGLYKTLFVTIEMRQEPFFLWIKDLSAPDPTAIGNLFGLLPIPTDTVTSIPFIGALLAVGVLPILYGISMWALQSLNPPPTDDTQKMIFGLMPIVFTFVFAGFAAGLVIYWVWSNTLSIIQQYAIMRRNGVKTQLDKFIEAKFGKKEGNAEG